MSQGTHVTDVQEKTQQLLQGRLKHAAAAGLAAALLPLAAVAITATSPEACSSAGTVCGFVWYDTDNDGVQDAGEPPIDGAVVTLNGTSVATTPEGFYEFPVALGTHTISVQIPPGYSPSPVNVGSNDALDSDGTSDGLGNSVGTVTLDADDTGGYDTNTDFGFRVTPVVQPGTGTPGFWKNHPEAWPASITVGEIVYTKEQALAWLDVHGKDKTTTMFSSLVSAMLNVAAGNDSSCVSETITAANEWMADYPVGSGVHAASLAWKIGEPLHRQMDNYNNGMLCAPGRE